MHGEQFRRSCIALISLGLITFGLQAPAVAGIVGTADAIGARLARLAEDLQVLAVTHSPQVAARAARHFLITKIAEVGGDGERAVTRVAVLPPEGRREEIARMLSGAEVTDAARAQAEQLLTGRG